MMPHRPIPRVRRQQQHSPRHLVLRHVEKHITSTQKLRDGFEDDPDIGPLNHGEEVLYSFYTPGLEAGRHDISVTQIINTPAEGNIPAAQKTIQSTKIFKVNPPRFSLPEGEIHSTYPPQGHGDESRILPHIVLTDPHLPWERLGSTTEKSTVSANEFDRNRTPWMALLSFSEDSTGQNELHLTSDQLNGSNSIFPLSMRQVAPVTQSSTYTTYMYLNDLWAMPSVATPIRKDQVGDPVDGNTKSNIIFVPTELFTAFVTKYDDNGLPTAKQTVPELSRYKFLSHVRHINTTGMTQAGVEDDGLFSIIMGHRSGPLNIVKPTTVVVHLVSLENVQATPPESGIVLPIAEPYVGLASLYSWSYQCLPPASLSVADAFTEIGSSVVAGGILLAPSIVPPSSKTSNPTMDLVKERMTDGYSLVRYRTQSGDVTVALNRGPLTPTIVSYPLSTTIGGWKMFSTFGSDLQILDKALGIMDITYSAAWQLGKAMAMADRSFAGALTRLRSAIHAGAIEGTKKELLQSQHKSKEEVIASLSETTTGLLELFQGREKPDMKSRWNRRRGAPVSLSHRQSDDTRKMYAKHGLTTGRKLASTTDIEPSVGTSNESDPPDTPLQPYNEFNTPYSGDWKVLMNWVLDKMYLVDLPAHYLIPDPSYLPNETLKFFHIDANWIDSFLDGALSLANQVSREDDEVRGIIKALLEIYTTGQLSPLFGYAPQIPTFGFLMRSSIVTRFPDLVVTAPRAPGDARAPILRQENIAKDTLLCLFDRVPSDSDFKNILISQPPHQQFFSVGATLGPGKAPEGSPPGTLGPMELELIYRRVYAPITKVDPHIKDSYTTDVFKKSDTTSPYFDWTHRTMIVEPFATLVYDRIRDGMNNVVPNLPVPGPPAPNFTDKYELPSAALLGIQMNEPMYQLNIAVQALVAGAGTSDYPSTIESSYLSHEKHVGPSGYRHQDTQHNVRGHIHKRYPAPKPHERRRPACSAINPHPPPHMRSRRLAVPMPIRLGAPSDGTDQNFIMGCHHISSFGKPIPTNLGIPIDLVFSIRLNPSYNPNWTLNSLSLMIPMVSAHPSPKSPPLVEANYQDATVVMLSNMRFNAWGPVASKNNDFLCVQLIPRHLKGQIPLKLVNECSFILNQVRVVQGVKRFTWVNVFQNFSAVSGPNPPQVEKSFLVNMGQ